MADGGLHRFGADTADTATRSQGSSVPVRRIGGLSWSSQHLDREQLWWWHGNGRTGRVGLGCGCMIGRRQISNAVTGYLTRRILSNRPDPDLLCAGSCGGGAIVRAAIFR
ncbi:MAG: hypothetical protein JWR32_879 [Mycobacterium sp.]|jgi:hypothetical protein|nr:hypothetical protein [Mycobacterium sp.]